LRPQRITGEELKVGEEGEGKADAIRFPAAYKVSVPHILDNLTSPWQSSSNLSDVDGRERLHQFFLFLAPSPVAPAF
jgi:hypothetical protein